MFGQGRLERRLRAERPEPEKNFLRQLTAQIEAERAPVPHRPSARIGLAIAVAAGSLVAAGLTGGLSYAAAAVGNASTSVAHTLNGSSSPTSSSLNSNVVSAAGTEYSAAGYYCFKNPGNNQAYTETYISSSSDFASYTSQGYVAERYDDGNSHGSDTCNYGHFH
jgi:hypothetical protein